MNFNAGLVKPGPAWRGLRGDAQEGVPRQAEMAVPAWPRLPPSESGPPRDQEAAVAQGGPAGAAGRRLLATLTASGQQILSCRRSSVPRLRVHHSSPPEGQRGTGPAAPGCRGPAAQASPASGRSGSCGSLGARLPGVADAEITCGQRPSKCTPRYLPDVNARYAAQTLPRSSVWNSQPQTRNIPYVDG